MSSSQKELSLKDLESISSIIKNKFQNYYQIIYSIDPQEGEDFKRRNGYYHNEIHKNTESEKESIHPDNNLTCCSHNNNIYNNFYIPDSKQSIKEKILNESTKLWKIKLELPKILKYLSDRFWSIKCRRSVITKKNNNNIKKEDENELEWNNEVQSYILKGVMKEGIKHYYINILNSLIQKEGKKDSTSHLLIANPQQWKVMFPNSPPLQYLSANVLQNIFCLNSDPVEISNFYEDNLSTGSRRELKFLERDGKFEEMNVESLNSKERSLNVYFSNIPKNNLPNLHESCKILCSIPFELNEKTSYGFMLSEGIKFCCLNPKDFQCYKMSNYNTKDCENGIALQVFVFYNRNFIEKKSGIHKEVLLKVKENNDQNPKEWIIPADRSKVIIIKARKCQWKLENLGSSKRFVTIYFVKGAMDLNNNYL